MEAKTAADVCSFLIARQVCPRVVEKFKLQKIDGSAVKLLSDDHLNNLGLTAIGDQVTLRDMCHGNTGNVESASSALPTVDSSRSERRKALLRALRDSMNGRSRGPQQHNNSQSHPGGRPKQQNRKFTFGLRLSEEKRNSIGDRMSSQVKSPLGDKNNISIQITITEEYTNSLKIVTDAFFPKGENPVIGSESDYLLELVNSRNQNVRESMEAPFTFGKYIEEKKIPGTPKCYLLCTDLSLSDEAAACTSIDGHKDITDETIPLILLNDDDELPDLPSTSGVNTAVTEENKHILLDDDDELPDLLSTSGVNTTVPEENKHTEELHVPGTPSGEVVLIIRQPNTMDEERSQWDTIEKCVEGTIKAMRQCADPIEVLKFYESAVHQGRALEADSTCTTVTEGDTNPIYVSRYNMFETGMQELIGLDNYRVTLDVTFYGEMAQDLGGPRREFLTLMMKEALKEDRGLFVKTNDGYIIHESTPNLRQNYYYGTGLLAAISMLQQGPLLSFVEETQLQKLLKGHNLSGSEKQFREGLNRLGFIDLVIGIPCLVFLLRPTAQKEINFRHLQHLLHPQFAEMGSNQRQMEERTYSLFVSYLREVSAGRRNGVTLGRVLMFVTGTEAEPPLGFENNPTIVFSEIPFCLPRAQTCICQLTLPVGQNVPTMQNLFEIFDTAFVNSYFGMM